MSGRQLALVAVLVVVVALVAWRWKSDGTSAQHGHGPTAVELTAVRSGAAPVQLSAIGNVVSPHTVNVRAQAYGPLTPIFFPEADRVKAGDKLFQIDPAPYEPATAQAHPQLATQQATPPPRPATASRTD